MHPQLATLVLMHDGLDHRAEDVRIDLFPVQRSGIHQIAHRPSEEAGNLRIATEEAPVHMRELLGISR